MEVIKPINTRKEKPIYGVYKIENLLDGKVYVGKSKDIGRRWYEHKYELNKGKHINKHLQNSWNKYGENCFRFEILEETDSEEEALEREEYYIKKYETTNKKLGYNLTYGGQSGLPSDETIRKSSQLRIGKYNNLTEQDIKRIKMLLYCFMDQKEIAEIFDVSLKTIQNISQVDTYKHILSEVNPYIRNVKQQIIDDRNKKILDLYDNGYRIFEIKSLLKESQSSVEKCIYKYRPFHGEKYDDTYDKKVIDMYFNKNMSSIKINELIPVSKPKIMEIINFYKMKTDENFGKLKQLDKGMIVESRLLA